MFLEDTANFMPSGPQWFNDGLDALYPQFPRRISCIKMIRMKQLKERDT